MSQDVPIRDASTVILYRSDPDGPSVLMGQRGAQAAFMPNKVVFPGGAVDRDDASVPLLPPGPLNAKRLAEHSNPDRVTALAAAAIRELWEETGQILGAAADWPDPPKAWGGFAQRGFQPDARPLHLFFRAITPKGRPRRFDARFFLADAKHLQTDPDDFSEASDELSHLQWVPVAEAQRYDLPFITEVVMAEIAHISEVGPPTSVPFFRNDDEESLFLRLRGHPLAE